MGPRVTTDLRQRADVSCGGLGGGGEWVGEWVLGSPQTHGREPM